ncbi:MAG: hypothetical protein QNK35_16540 [Bacteroides sp.]|nr:hypothetical protein [Bacteroides sp.]
MYLKIYFVILQMKILRARPKVLLEFHVAILQQQGCGILAYSSGWLVFPGIAPIELLSTHRSNLNDGLVHGRIVLELIPGTTNQAQVAYKAEAGGRGELYNFEWIPGAGLKRNLGTMGGLFVATLMAPTLPGKRYNNYTFPSPFPIIYQGTVTIQQ